MRLFIWALILLAGCTDANKAPRPSAAIQVTGYLQDGSLDEASGLARSHRHAGLLWAINDDGPAVLHALGVTGNDLGRVRIANVNNRDWEDLASFTLDGVAYLLIADIGDNSARRETVSLYIVEEPEAGERRVNVAWRINFTYPDGPRDAEAIAVDADGRQILVLTKRDVPAILYELPLVPGSDDTIIATRLGAIDSLPQPSQRDIKSASLSQRWHWQPTAMDVAADGRSALVLTYSRVYHYQRNEAEPWIDTLSRSPLHLRLGGIPYAESIAFGERDDIAFVTTEKRNAPLLRIALRKNNE